MLGRCAQPASNVLEITMKSSYRSYHVKIQIDRDLICFGLVEAGDIEFTPEKSVLFSSPPVETLRRRLGCVQLQLVGVARYLRTALVTENFVKALATARIPIEPEPSSLMPGPALTESLWAPSATTELGSPPLV